MRRAIEVDDRLDNALRQWGLYAHYDAEVGPEVRTACGSAEGAYVAPLADGDVETLLPPPNVDLAEAVDRAWRCIQSPAYRRILSMHYVSLFFVPIEYGEDKLVMIGSKRLGISPDEYENRLNGARVDLRRILNHVKI